MMPLSGTIQSAPANSRGFDTDTVISSATAQQFAAQGYTFCIRYLSLGSGQDPGDLSSIEASEILASGLALMVVQHVDNPGWSPSQNAGQTNGNNAAANADTVGLSPGLNVWCDLEGVATSATAQDVIDYCSAWYNSVSAAGYVPGLYVGANAVLNGQQLYDLPFEHYWQSCSEVPAVAVRGYQMVQTFVQNSVNGVGIDDDTTQTDQLGGQALWWTQSHAT
ncbi:glycoside hydrolase domain-containing protein [Pseudomonas sp. PB3P13]